MNSELNMYRSLNICCFASCLCRRALGRPAMRDAAEEKKLVDPAC